MPLPSLTLLPLPIVGVFSSTLIAEGRKGKREDGRMPIPFSDCHYSFFSSTRSGGPSMVVSVMTAAATRVACLLPAIPSPCDDTSGGVPSYLSCK